MKKVFSVLSFVLVGLAAVAQSDTAELRKAATKICDCMNKEPKSKMKTAADLQRAMQKCLMSDALTDMMEIANKRGVQMNDQEGMKKIAFDLSLELAKINCAAMVDFAVANAGGTNMEKTEKEDNTETGATKMAIDGKITKVESLGGHIKLTVLAANKKTTTVTWLRYFAGSEKYTANPKLLIGKTVSITYADFEVIDPVTKSYINLKEIKTLQAN
jgi:hypothetical protein